MKNDFKVCRRYGTKNGVFYSPTGRAPPNPQEASINCRDLSCFKIRLLLFIKLHMEGVPGETCCSVEEPRKRGVSLSYALTMYIKLCLAETMGIPSQWMFDLEKEREQKSPSRDNKTTQRSYNQCAHTVF